MILKNHMMNTQCFKCVGILSSGGGALTEGLICFGTYNGSL